MIGFSFNSIYILESLGDNDISSFSGEALYSDLKMRLFRFPNYKIEHLGIRSRKELKLFCNRLQLRIRENSEMPLLHFSFHGYDGGIVFNHSSERICWRELGDLLIPINIENRLNLMVNFSSCYGGSVSRIIDFSKRAPFLISISPLSKIKPETLYEYYLEFYQRLINTKDIIGSLESKQKLKDNFLPIFNFSYFIKYLEIAEKTFFDENFEVELEDYISRQIESKKIDAKDRERIRLSKILEYKDLRMKQLMEQFKNHFMLDLYPDHFNRFRLDKIEYYKKYNIER